MAFERAMETSLLAKFVGGVHVPSVKGKSPHRKIARVKNYPDLPICESLKEPVKVMHLLKSRKKSMPQSAHLAQGGLTK